MILMEALPARMPDIFHSHYSALNPNGETLRDFRIQPPQEGDLEAFSRHSTFKERWEIWLQSRTFENLQEMLKAYSLFLFKQEGLL